VLAQAWHKAFRGALSLYSDFQEFLAPSLCLCCGRDRDFEDKLLCPDCIDSLNRKNVGYGPICPFCGNPNAEGPCISCRPPADLRLYYWGAYENELQECILQFKFHGARELGIRMIEMAHGPMADQLPKMENQIIVPVPLHKRRQRLRQYNQSELLAGRLAELRGAEFRPESLRRARATFQQAKLAEDMRWNNVRDAFVVPPELKAKIAGRHILLVDDIVTTGATVYEASKALYYHGALRVGIFSLAYTV
jgi:ComF family protein